MRNYHTTGAAARQEFSKISNTESPVTGAAQQRLLLTVRQAAEALSICEKSLWNLTKRGDLPAVRIGKSVRYTLEDLQSFIGRSKVVAHE
jgi:excisionase family DNA binding protein